MQLKAIVTKCPLHCFLESQFEIVRDMPPLAQDSAGRSASS